MASIDHKNEGAFARGWGRMKGLLEKSRTKIVEFASKMKKLGQDDPRRIIHSLKAGLAVTLVSLFYYFEPIYDGFGVSGMWAILTVVVVFEFSVGATLGRGLNRVLATFSAGTLGFGAHHLANLCGEKGEPVLLGLFVFLLAAGVTFVRFFPRMKARYDYGLLIFILTFCLVSVSGYRDDEILDIAHKRVSTILIGSFTALFVCICICPVWAGDDLHNLTATNVEKLGGFLEGFGVEYFKKTGDREVEKEFLKGYKSVLNSKQNEESLANFARWEPGHGRFRFRHPWKQYLKIGSLTRQCAYRIEALNGYLSSEIQTSLEIRSKIQDPCMKMSSESGKALKELALAIRTMTQPVSASPHIANSKNAAKALKLSLKTSLCNDNIDLLGTVPAATVASLLVDVVSCTEKIAESMQELASLAHFKSLESRAIQTFSSINGPHHVITIDGTSPGLPENGNPTFRETG